MKRIFLIVPDNKGIGAAGDAEEYGEKRDGYPRFHRIRFSFSMSGVTGRGC